MTLGDPLPSPALKQRVLSAAAARPAATRSEVRARNAAIGGAAAFATIAVFLLAGGVRTFPRPTALLVQTAGGAAVVAAIALRVAYARGRSMNGRPAIALASLCVFSPLALLAWKILASAGDPAMTAEWPERAGFACLGLGLLLAASPFAAMFTIRRRSDPANPRLAGASLGVAAAACSWLLADLWCPVGYLPHLLVGHVLPIAILASAGVLAADTLRARQPS